MNGRDDRALDALIVLAFLDSLTQEVPSLSVPEPDLDPDDERALDELGPDLVRRIFEEEGR